jgi:hypothetical protein
LGQKLSTTVSSIFAGPVAPLASDRRRAAPVAAVQELLGGVELRQLPGALRPHQEHQQVNRFVDVLLRERSHLGIAFVHRAFRATRAGVGWS